ncbi:histone H3.v1-like isoform X2 [Macrobrachium nipponense]|uniref:histone H3.v1-like isoform X2 n=1 Tax=Macrobrachium nipponense TaxID=159736 RepID=UPI0030C7ABBA
MSDGETLQLEWAWKPMAAVMNEKQTDLVYWIPPLYRNNIKTAGSRVRRKTVVHRTSINRASLNRLPYTHLQAAHMYSQLQASQRKKKLARRRAKLATEVSFEDPTDTESIVRPRRRSRVAREISLEDPTDTTSIVSIRRRSKLGQRVSFENATDTDSAVLDSRSDSKSEWQDAKDEDIESGIHDEMTDYNADDLSLHNVQSLHEEEVVRPTGATTKRRLGEHRRANRTAFNKPKVPPKPDFIAKSFEAIDKPKPAPTLIRLLEKVSHIHCPPVNPVKPIKPELRKISRRGSESKSSLKGKVRRPSVKVYGNSSTRLSSRRSKPFDDQNDLESQCVIVSVDNEALKSPPKASPKPPPKSSTKSSSKPSTKSSSKPSSKSSPKPTTKSMPKSHGGHGSIKDLKKGMHKDMPKTPTKPPQEPAFGILKDQQPFGILKDNPVKPDEAEFRNAQLQMILRLLAQLYEEKVSRQDAEIQNMKARIQTQDKLMKQMAHVVLELKEEISRFKLQSSVPRHDIPANVLNIKVGDN